LLFFGFQKLKRFESELSKALDLAQGYKEKFGNIEKEKLELIERHIGEIKEMMDRIQEGQQKLDKAKQLNCLLIQQKEESLEKVKQAEQDAQKVCKYELNMVQCNVTLNVNVTEIFIILFPVHIYDNFSITVFSLKKISVLQTET
jgi:hypothetical protein